VLYAASVLASDSHRSPLIRDNVLVALGTALSRATGFLRVLVLGWAVIPVVNGVGDGRLADAYNLANTTPNIIFELVLGGILSATLVPVFTRALAERDDDAVNAIVGTATALLAVVTVVTTLAAPVIIWLYTILRSSNGVSEYRSVATALAYLFLPQIFFYGVTSIGSALLNAKRRFFAAAWAPVLTNIVVIVGLILARRSVSGVPSLETAKSTRHLVVLLGLSATLGVAAMAVALVPAVRRAGIRLRPRVDVHHPAVHEVVRLSGWTIGYVIANQVALAVVTVLAQREPGALSAYTTMFIFFQLPHGLLAVTVMTTFTPELSTSAAANDTRRFRIGIRQGMRVIVGLLLPAATIYAVLAGPATHLSGRFASLNDAAPVLRGFAVGLVGFSVYLFVLRGFYARKDTRTPFVLNVVENALNVVAALILVGPFGVAGLAWAYSLAYGIAAVLAWRALDKAVPGGLRSRLLRQPLARALVAASAMGVTLWLARDLVGSDTGWGAVARLVVAGSIGSVVYFATLIALGGLDPHTPTAPWALRTGSGARLGP
jgi:putative peptidoglycan lipid II flippase